MVREHQQAPMKTYVFLQIFDIALQIENAIQCIRSVAWMRALPLKLKTMKTINEITNTNKKDHEYELDPLGSTEHTILASNFQTVFACFDTFDSLHRDRIVMICHALRRLNLTHFIVKLFHCDLLSNGMYLVLQCVFHRLFDVYLSSFVDLLLVFFSLKFFFFSLLFAIFLISSLEISYFFSSFVWQCVL